MSAIQPEYEVCVVGAGITGLNALVVATSYLSSSDKVALADARTRAGGMWVDTYDYVRLHQPHGIFTAGDIRWTSGMDPSHLASRPEVLEHLQHCLDVAKQRVGVDEFFGWEYLSHEERDEGVEISFRSGEATMSIHAKRLVKAFGHRVTPSRPMTLSSGRVHSTTPEALDVRSEVFRDSEGPVWVIGGGKTAMDTAHLLITELPGREVSLAAGPGVMFARRETFFPTGMKRWWGGTPINSMARGVAQRFDGTNEAVVRDWFHDNYGIGLADHPQDFFNAYLSDGECDVIRSGLRTVAPEYLSDVVDGEAGPQLVFRSGATHDVPDGTWIVNCTGYLLRDSHPYEPFVSRGGRVLSIQMRSSTTGAFSAFAGYYLSHLLFLDLLGSVGLYALDMEELHRKDKTVAVYCSMSLTMHNLSLIADAVPMSVILGCGLDFDRWYPLPRRLIGSLAFLRAHRREREHHRQALDTIGRRFEVTSGPLTSVTAD